MAESTREGTRLVLLRGCKRHKCQFVAIIRSDLHHAIGDEPASEFLRKNGRSQGDTKAVRLPRLKLLALLEKSRSPV